VYIRISGEFDRIMVNQCDFIKSYELELQQNQGVTVILSNSP